MTIGIKVVHQDGIFFLSGVIDETFNFEPFLVADPPLKIDLAGVKAINSLGIRSLLSFIKKWQPRPFEYYNCPTCFVDTVNIFPHALGIPPVPSRMQSFMVSFICDRCKDIDEGLVWYSDLTISGDVVRIPDRLCQRCHVAMDLDGDPDDFFLFITCPT